MTGIEGSITFPQENVTEVAAAIGAQDLGPLPVRIRDPLYGSVDFVVETGPPAE